MKKFDHACVISLKSREDRLNKFKESFKSTGLKWKIETVCAIDGKDKDCPQSFGNIGGGAFGCWMSHLSVLLTAIQNGWKNYVVFEDDAQFEDGFAKTLTAALQELPSDWDQLYLGFQPWNTRIAKLESISEHLWRIGDANRTHAYAINGKAYDTFLRHLVDIKEKPWNYHIDHWLGELHRKTDSFGRNTVNVYGINPQIVSQSEGVSDISGRTEVKRTWLPSQRDVAKTAPNVLIESFKVGYGTLGKGGSLGFDGRKVSGGTGDYYFSAHAPSELKVKLSTGVTVFPFMNRTGGSDAPIKVNIDGIDVGTIQDKSSKVDGVHLTAGDHTLAFEVTGSNNHNCHTVWGIIEDRIPVIEILCNTACKRNCPGCNQESIRKAEPSYEYTVDDAKALVSSLSASGQKVKVCFTGGEPALWSQSEGVTDLFAASSNIIGMWVVTSEITKENIERLKELFGVVKCSIRNETKEYLTNKPEWLTDCDLWDQTLHAIPDTASPVANISCCCKGQGIVASIVGKTVYPCVLGRSLELAGKWNDCPKLTIDDFFSTGFDDEIGTYEVCKSCVNNIEYRKVANKSNT